MAAVVSLTKVRVTDDSPTTEGEAGEAADAVVRVRITIMAGHHNPSLRTGR